MLFSKSKFIEENLVSINEVNFPNEKETKDLGIYYKNNLNFDNYIQIITRNALRKVNYVKYTCC